MGAAASRGKALRTSVVICTYAQERWDDLLAAVASVKRQNVPPDEIVVVVDHNDDLALRLESVLTSVDIVTNRHGQGLSGARNTGVEMSSGDVVAFLDDDAVAHPDWLGTLRDAYSDDGVIGVDGTAVPLWEDTRPLWFPREFDWVVGCTYAGRMPGAVRNLLGSNASFRREAFAIAGGFHTRLGRTSKERRPLGCEETEFCIRVTQQRPDFRFVYEPRAVIWHRVPSQRSRLKYFRSRCFAEGLSKAEVTRHVGNDDGLSVERRYAGRTLVCGIGRGVRDTLRGDTHGLSRSGAITLGFAATVAGYVRGRLGSP